MVIHTSKESLLKRVFNKSSLSKEHRVLSQRSAFGRKTNLRTSKLEAKRNASSTCTSSRSLRLMSLVVGLWATDQLAAGTVSLVGTWKSWKKAVRKSVQKRLADKKRDRTMFETGFQRLERSLFIFLKKVSSTVCLQTAVLKRR